MRGTHRRWLRGDPATRFIPAHAGNTCDRRRSRDAHTVHPRACGEHESLAIITTHIVGSSPRMRGTRVASLPPFGRRRFIPAHAGNTLYWRSALLTRPVHPRACGEHTHSRPHWIAVGGSSPRMRGTRTDRSVSVVVTRFIPAHAGNTGVRQIMRVLGSVHPRACGEHTTAAALSASLTGSSPRMRGTHFFHLAEIAAKK